MAIESAIDRAGFPLGAGARGRSARAFTRQADSVNVHACPAGGSPSSGLVNSAQAMLDQLGRYTDANGLATIDISTSGALGMQATRSHVKGGWHCDVWSGEFIAIDTSLHDH